MTQAPPRPLRADETPVRVPATRPAHATGATPVRPRDRRAARRAATGSRRPWVVALVLYTALVAVVIGWPTPVDAGARGTLDAVLDRLHDLGAPGWVGYDLVERAANVAMFVPLGLLVTRVTRRWWWGLAIPAALSAAAEVSQHLLRPERFATWTDVATNTTGAALGVAVAVVLMRRRARRRAPMTPRP